VRGEGEEFVVKVLQVSISALFPSFLLLSSASRAFRIDLEARRALSSRWALKELEEMVPVPI
jgi:hypothetical protein